MPKLLSSDKIISILKSQGFVFISQKGSHQKHRKHSHTVIVPAGRNEVPVGTLKSIIRQSGLDKTLFR